MPITWYPESFVEKVPMSHMNLRPNSSRGYPGRTYRFYTGETVYSFGDGLSYSNITYELIQAPESVSVRDLECDPFEMSLQVVNLGKGRVSHSVLLFSTPPFVHGSPRKQLVDFQKVILDEKEATTLTFKVHVCRHLSIVDEHGTWRTTLGQHVFQAGNVMHSLNVNI